jgi:penicillin amidase
LLGDDDTLLNMFLGTGTTILAPVNGYNSRNKALLIRLLNEHNDAWFADSTIPNSPKSWDAALAVAFHAAIEDLREKFGDDISQWRYGKMHKMTYAHPLGRVKPLNKIFNRGPYAVGGDIDTVNMGATWPNQPEVVITVPSYRQIVNLADVAASLSGHAPGQSGHPASKHYADFIQSWLRVEHHPMLFERSTIEENAEGPLEMIPENP